MTAKLDYSATWNDGKSLLAAHRDGVGAVAALFLFVPDWAARLFAGQPDMEGVNTPAGMVAAYQAHYLTNWHWLLPAGLLGFFGAVALYVLLIRRDMPTVGSALGKALAFLPFYFIVQLAGMAMTLGGLILLILPGLYISGRLAPLGAVTVTESECGFAGIISRCWELTRGNGWAIFFFTFIIALVASLTAMIIGLIVGLACRLIAGADGVPFVETGVDAALGAVVATLMLALSVAIYRQLAGQD